MVGGSRGRVKRDTLDGVHQTFPGLFIRQGSAVGLAAAPSSTTTSKMPPGRAFDWVAGKSTASCTAWTTRYVVTSPNTVGCGSLINPGRVVFSTEDLSNTNRTFSEHALALVASVLAKIGEQIVSNAGIATSQRGHLTTQNSTVAQKTGRRDILHLYRAADGPRLGKDG